jgi:hypothetical protein
MPSEKPESADTLTQYFVFASCDSTPLSIRFDVCELFFLSESDGHPSLTTATLHTRQNVSISKPPSGEPVNTPILKKPRRPTPSTYTFRLFLPPALIRAAKSITHRDPA